MKSPENKKDDDSIKSRQINPEWHKQSPDGKRETGSIDRENFDMLSAGAGSECGCLEFYNEDKFKDLLAKERKRTERTGVPFTLVLVDVGNLVKIWQEDKNRQGLTDLQKIIRSTSSIMRETDIRGWYEEFRVVGMIFTANDKRNEHAVQDKVRKQICSVMNGHGNVSVEVTTLTFQTNGSGSLSEIELKFYPESESGRWGLFKKTVKRLFDISGSLLAILLFSPVFIMVPFLIKLETEGPVFYKQKRVGYRGEEFTLYKFRSMYTGNDDTVHKEYVRELIRGQINRNENGIYKITNDNRVTAIGKLLRKTSLDELPQFFNVLRGDMSIVGPRPAIPYETAEYLPWHFRRIMDGKPGITGVWQVYGRSRTNFDTMARMDIDYCKRQSVLLDLKLTIKTPMAIFMARGAM